jgi:hypothetical protein
MPTLMFMRRPASVIGVLGLEVEPVGRPVTSTSDRCFSHWLGRSPSTLTNSSIATGTSPG